ncbi:DUF2924 domain-containing protein [uncultured Erythrobacter sp.]|uniref:DUF2924 domain-containing protein n=1 Tax=uncultured Erythrobacter sp. TaxID=263913 RepID=UPI00260D54E3|nr:DUF2924 domain-containing protein [uncultured Erythrobacter sp.]
MSDTAPYELDSLEELNYQQLRVRCERAGLDTLPPRLSPELMRHLLADTMQRKQHPKLPSDSAILRALERSLCSDSSSQAPLAQSGTVLTRDWKGKRHTVRVSEDGYKWEGETYRSLSRIAQLITGTRWSGPRFFGVQS